jgi:hypothetical protein
MKKIGTIVGLLIFVSVMVISCDLFGDNNPFVGTWKTSLGYTVTFTDSSWELPNFSGGGYYNIGWKGTYTYSGNTAYITYTEVKNNGENWRNMTSAEKSALSGTATISGNTLTWGISTYTRQ